ncbi:MAG: DUF308 domain-containing protein, partial [Acutalibacteraceae bacterium]
KDTVATCVIEIIFGAVLFAFPDFIPTVIAYVIGALLIAYGVNSFISYSKTGAGIISGIFECLIGIVFIICAKTIIGNIISLVFGMYFIIKGAISLSAAVTDIQIDKKDGIIEIVFASVTLLFGIVLFFLNPTKIFFIVCGVFLIVNGIIDLIEVLTISKKVKSKINEYSKSDNIIDVEYIEINEDDNK